MRFCPRASALTVLASACLFAAPYQPPASPRTRTSFDLNWKFIHDDVAGAESPAFDDSKWTAVTLPHSFNDVDSFRVIINHSGGDRGTFKGVVWYRKHFKLPAADAQKRSSSNSKVCARPATSS